MWAPASNAHAGSDWHAGFDDSTMPWYAMMDSVEYHSWNPATNDFDFEWADDFSSFDTNKWVVSNDKGFAENHATYKYGQVYVADGNLVLKMEKDP